MSYEQIWAPWRLEYLQHPAETAREPEPSMPLLPGADPGCFLCQGAADPHERRRYVIHRSPLSVVLLNLFPYNNGHLLVAPKRHCAGLDELTDEEHLDLSQTITKMLGTLGDVLRPDGFNLGLNLGKAAGAGVPGHLHWHIVPRWGGDTNFMLTTASTKVIPQALDSLWQALTAFLGKAG